MDAPDYSIVVPAYNEERFLGRTLADLRQAMDAVPARGEIVVCDNHSTDGTADVARAGGARLAYEPVNQISRARNTGARAARGRHLVFVDADTHVPQALLVAALRALESGRACGGGAIVHFEGVGPRGALAAATRFWNWLARRHRLAAGSFLFATHEAFDAVGGFSEQVYASEEIWLSRSLQRWGGARGQEFVILDGLPVLTSNRKAEWFSPGAVILAILLVVLFPFAVRSRRLCWLWYRRPPLPVPPR